MDAVERRLMALEAEVRKLRRKIRISENEGDANLFKPIVARSLTDAFPWILGYKGEEYETEVGYLPDAPYVFGEIAATDVPDASFTIEAYSGKTNNGSAVFDINAQDSTAIISFTLTDSSGNTATYTFDEDSATVEFNGSGNPISLTGGSMKVTGGGYYLIPAGPGVGTTVASSASADTYGSWTEMRAAAGNALYIVGVSLYALNTEQYTQLDIGTGAAASETSVSEVLFNTDGTNGIDQTVYFTYPIAVAASTRIACRTADEDASARNSRVTLLVVDQADVAAL